MHLLQRTDDIRYAPLLVAVSHVAAVVYLTFTVSLGLYQSYKGLSPSQDTRLRIHKRRVLAPMFGGLSLAALASDAYHKLGYLTLSYKVWAHERGIAFPARYTHRRSHVQTDTANKSAQRLQDYIERQHQSTALP